MPSSPQKQKAKPGQPIRLSSCSAVTGLIAFTIFAANLVILGALMVDTPSAPSPSQRTVTAAMALNGTISVAANGTATAVAQTERSSAEFACAIGSAMQRIRIPDGIIVRDRDCATNSSSTILLASDDETLEAVRASGADIPPDRWIGSFRLVPEISLSGYLNAADGEVNAPAVNVIESDGIVAGYPGAIVEIAPMVEGQEFSGREIVVDRSDLLSDDVTDALGIQSPHLVVVFTFAGSQEMFDTMRPTFEAIIASYEIYVPQ